MRSSRTRAFTLIEILIVVLILGILAGIVVPQFASATDEARKVAVVDQLTKIREALAVYHVRNAAHFPEVSEGDGTWGQILSIDYLRDPPLNGWVGAENGAKIVLRDTPDAGYQDTYGWIFDPSTGDVWAGGYDGGDDPFPRP